MNSMKKIISVILACAMVLSMFVMVYAEDTGATTQAVKYAEEIGVIKAMGIINGDETGAFNADANLTRAEFAQVLTVLLKINYGDVAKENAWYYKFEIPEDLDNVLLTPSTGLVTGDEEQPSAPAVVEKVQKFDDVPTTHWAYGVISQITDIGYMIGTSETEFSPEDPVTVNQVNKVLVKILGYEQFANINGGYPAGFNYLASTLKVLKGVNNFGENPITRGELAKMLYNMFDVNMIAAVSITDEGVATYTTSDKTFLNDVLGVFKYEGKVTDNGTTAILGQSQIDDNKIKIGNVVFDLADTANYVKGFIGRLVEFYVVEDKDTGRMMVIYAALAEDGEDFAIEIDKFENLANGKLEYIDEDEKIDYLKVSNTPTVIFNGSKVEGVTKEEIKAFSNGTVTALKSGTGDIYDTIVIEGFVSMYVKNVIASEKLISNGLIKAGEISDYSNLDLSKENNKNREITIIKNGADAAFEDIKTGMIIDVAKSQDAIKVVISDKKENITIFGTSVDELGDSYIYSAEGGEYILAKELVSSKAVKVPELSTEATAFFNSFGEIAYFDASSATLEGLGILINGFEDGRGLKKDCKVRIFLETGAFADYILAEKVAFTDENDVYEKKEDEKILEKLANYKDTLITFTTTEEGLISEIAMPLSFANQDERANGRLGIFFTAGAEAHYSGSAFDGQAFTRNSPKIIYISPDKDAEEISRYQIKTSAVIGNDTTATGIVAYNKDPKSLNATHIVINDGRYTNYTPQVRNTEFFVVESVKQALNIDGDPVVRVSGYEMPAQNNAITAKTYESSTGAFTNMIPYVGNTVENVTRYSVKAGDIINLFESNGNVEYAALVYRNDLNYSRNPRKMGGALAGQESGLFETSGKGNPFVVSSSGLKVETNGFKITANSATGTNANIPRGGIRMFDGFPVRVYEGIISITNMDLSDSANIYKVTDDTQVTNAWTAPSYALVMDVRGDKVSLRTGNSSDIKTYEDYGSDCSRVLVHAYQGTIYKLIIINVED